MDHDTPIHLRPQVWLERFIQGKDSQYFFFVELMSCIQYSDVPSVLKYLPSNLFENFNLQVKAWSEAESEEDILIVASSRQPWGLEDVQNVFQWLKENPNPELGPPIEN